MNKYRWTSYDIRNYCISRNFYTCGDNKAYSKMLYFVAMNKPTKRNVELVAIDIIAHSDRYSNFDEGDIKYIASEIWNDVVYSVDD